MQFLIPNSTEVEPLLNNDNLIYKDDIDIKIVEGSDIVGFIISTETPVRFIGVSDFGCHGLSFDEYRISLLLETLEFTYNSNTYIIPNLESSDDLDSGTRPYIANENNFVLFPNSTVDIVLTGGIYDPSIEIDFGPEIIFNHYTSVEPQQLIVNLTASDTDQSPYDVIMTRGGQYHYGNTPTFEVSSVIIGSGDAGTFTTDFNAGGSGNTAWGVDWDLSISGTIDSLDGLFKTSNAGTPSSGTGPSAPIDGFYMFTERSGSNAGVDQIAMATTNNFHQLTQLEFHYHMSGDNFGNLIVESQNVDDSWSQRWIQVGSSHAAQADPFLLTTLDATTWDCKAIRFVLDATTGWSSDAALDNIILTSI